MITELSDHQGKAKKIVLEPLSSCVLLNTSGIGLFMVFRIPFSIKGFFRKVCCNVLANFE